MTIALPEHVPLAAGESPPQQVLAVLRSLVPLLQDAAEKADEGGSVLPETWAVVRRAGLLRAPLPVASGGAGLLTPAATACFVDVLRLLGGADLVLGRLFEGHANALGLVERFGTAAQADRVADAVRDGALAAVWGADDADPLRATREGDRLHLSGRKVYASGAGFVRHPLVTAATPDGPVLLLLDLAPGERTEAAGWTAQGMRATATGSVTLDGVVLPAACQIGRPGDVLRQPHFSGGAWRFCAVHLGAAERLLDLLRAHLAGRKRDGDPYQVQRVAACAVSVGTAAFWVKEAARRVTTEADDPEALVAFVNLTRGVTERAGLDVLEHVHRGVGLPGFLRPHPVERITRDLATYLRQPVPDLAMADGGKWVLRSARAAADLWPAA